MYGSLPPSDLLLITTEDPPPTETDKNQGDEDGAAVWRIEKSVFGPRRKVGKIVAMCIIAGTGLFVRRVADGGFFFGWATCPLHR